jgi:hypothetical protein
VTIFKSLAYFLRLDACFSYLARKYDLWGRDDKEVIACEQLLCEVMDLRNAFVGFAYGRTGNPAAVCEAHEFITNAKTGIFMKLNLWLKRKSIFDADTPFFVGDHATAPDFHIFEMLDAYNALATHTAFPPSHTIFDDSLSHLSTFYTGFAALEKNRRYLSSPLHRAPFNNLTAVFGSLSSGTMKWEKGQELPDDIDGEY